MFGSAQPARLGGSPTCGSTRILDGRAGMRLQPRTGRMEGTAMVHLGYALSSEEYQADLGRFAARAEQGGFSLAMMSDHFDPWIDAQGQNPFVWTALGGMPRTAPFIANIRAFLT